MKNDKLNLSRSNPQSNEEATKRVFPVPKATMLRLTREAIETHIALLESRRERLLGDLPIGPGQLWRLLDELDARIEDCQRDLQELADEVWLESRMGGGS